MRARIALPEVETLSPAGRKIHDAIKATRGNVDGPFLAWLHSPELADEAQSLGAFCRYGTSLAPAESELLILIVANHFDCAAEWAIHAPIAAKAGLSAELIQTVATGAIPDGLGDRADILARCTASLLTTHRIPDDMFERAVAILEPRTLVEAVGLVGYYTLVAMTLNAFEMMPED